MTPRSAPLIDGSLAALLQGGVSIGVVACERDAGARHRMPYIVGPVASDDMGRAASQDMEEEQTA